MVHPIAQYMELREAQDQRAPKPSLALRPSDQLENIGARLGEPSPLRVLMRATGVPKCRMAGSMV